MAAPQLKEGFTSGTACAAAAKAAALVLAGGPVPEQVDTPLPLPSPDTEGERGRLMVSVERVEIIQGGKPGPNARGVVVKDAGHDPDVTHGAEFHAVVQLIPALPGVPTPDVPPVMIRGGVGVGKVTLPGLPVAPGCPAINPEPREQIEFAVREGLAGLSTPMTAIAVTIEVPLGEALARRTMNPRLGIEGGISILGRTGIVKPYSHDAFLASVSQGLDVAKATGADTAWLTTGRKSERLLTGLYPDLSPQAMVQCADLFAEGTAMAARRGFKRIGWALFFGKLVKQAQGAPNTHAHRADVDLALVSRLAHELDAPPAIADGVLTANTARHALELLRPTGISHDLAARLVALARSNAIDFQEKAGLPGVEVLHVVFDYDESRLA